MQVTFRKDAIIEEPCFSLPGIEHSITSLRRGYEMIRLK